MAKPIIPSAATPVPSPVASDKPAPLSKAAKVALFNVPRDIDAEIAALNGQIATANDRKSAAIKAIEDSCGNGPFAVRGEIVRISSRTLKNDDGSAGKTVHFFKGQGRADVETIG